MRKNVQRGLGLCYNKKGIKISKYPTNKTLNTFQFLTKIFINIICMHIS